MTNLATWPARKMAAGGMAEVFLAQQRGLAGFERLVVVKRIRRELNRDPRFVDLFLAEARLAAQLRHPNIVEIHDILRHDDDYFIVMDYLAGEDLRTVFRVAQSNPMPVAIAASIVGDVAAGLAHAHEARDLEGNPLNIVHRDVSPSNVIVTYSGVAELIDFGIAEANSHHVYTRPDRLRGKLAYSSPEQVSHEPVDAQSDVFSLGVVFFELLTRRRLFRGDSPASVVRAVMEQEIPLPSSLNPQVTPELDQVVMHALTRDRAERTENAQAFREELEHALQSSGLRVGSDEVASWMRSNLHSQLERRHVFERSIAEEPAGALLGVSETTSNSLMPSDLSFSHSASAPSRRSRLWYALGAVAIIALFGIVFALGLQRPDGPAGSGVLVHATPAEAALYVNDELVADSVGPGVALEARPGERLALRLELDGYRDHREEVIATESERELFFTLVGVVEGDAPEIARADTRQPTRTESAPTMASSVSLPSMSRVRRPTRMSTRSTPAPTPTVEPSTPAEARLSIRSAPTGAQVHIDGRPRGASPLVGIRLEPGRVHVIELSRDGFRPWTTRLTPVPGDNPDIAATLEAIPEPQPATRPQPQPQPQPQPRVQPEPTRRRDITVPRSMVGDPGRGRTVVANRCSSCHPGGVSGGSRSASAWTRYFASGRHGRHAMLSDSFTRAQLADVKAYLIEHAAGVERQSVGGVR